MAATSSTVAERLTPRLGSFISLTSISEIRYEGFLCYNNPIDSTIGLRYVKCLGTEGRCKNGPQVLGSDRIIGFIHFRCNNIKDLQVISSPSPQSTSVVPNDPAIIQYHLAQPARTIHHGAANVSTINIGQPILPVTQFQFPSVSGCSSVYWGIPPPPVPTTVISFVEPNYWAGGFSRYPSPPRSLMQALYPRSVLHQNVIASAAVGSCFSEPCHPVLLPGSPNTLLPPFLPTPSVQLQSNISVVSNLSSSIPIPNNEPIVVSTVVDVSSIPASVTNNESGSTSAQPTIEEQPSPSHSLSETTVIMEPMPSDSTEENPGVINAETVIHEDEKERMDGDDGVKGA